MKIQASVKSLVLLFFSISLLSCSEPPPSLSPLNQDAIILAFGDSLTYGTGVNSKTQSYPAILSELTDLKVINKGIPSETSQQGLERLASILNKYQPDLVILCHGGNDIIRNLGKKQLKNNLNKMISLIQNSGADVVLIGVPSFGLMLNIPSLYPELASTYNIPIELNTLQKIERNPEFKSDQVHPNAQGYRLIAEHIYKLLQTSGAL